MNPSRLLSMQIVLAMLLVSCGPVYRTTYDYTPPPTAEGKTCAVQCETIRMQCEQIEDLKKEQCEFRARIDHERCLEKSGSSTRCSRDTCSVDREACVSRYNSCYRTCGGTVAEDRACVSGCDEGEKK